MRHISLLAVSLLALAACTPEKQQEADDYTQYVNPFIGTDFTGKPTAQAGSKGECRTERNLFSAWR